jgi:hypothetical protein
MKTLSQKFRLLISILVGLVLLTNCGGGDGPTAEEKATKLLKSGTWKTTSSTSTVILDNIDVKQDLFADLGIQFTDTQINVTGSSPVWVLEDANGNNTVRSYPWQFKEGSKATVLIRGGDDREITILELSSSVFKFTIEWDQTTYGDGRVKSLPGTYEFTLTK